jgi:hypothetical protein
VSGRDEDPGETGADQAAARARAEDQAWREIVDHYGEVPDLDGLIDLTAPLEPPAPRSVEFRVVRRIPPPEEPDELAFADDDERFTPPPLPPPAVISPERRLAWVGLVTAPLLMIAFQLLAYPLPGIVDFGLLIAFLASFGYLVATMSPRDPDDDGARI